MNEEQIRDTIQDVLAENSVPAPDGDQMILEFDWFYGLSKTILNRLSRVGALKIETEGDSDVTFGHQIR